MRLAKRLWNLYDDGYVVVPRAPELFEKLIDFYIILGFVPRQRHERALGENEKLKRENKVLADILGELYGPVHENGGKNIQEVWEEIMDRQREVNRDMADMFLALLRQLKGDKEEGGLIPVGLC